MLVARRVFTCVRPWLKSGYRILFTQSSDSLAAHGLLAARDPPPAPADIDRLQDNAEVRLGHRRRI